MKKTSFGLAWLRAITFVGAALAVSAPSVASAQEYLMSGSAEVATGGESGGFGLRRARTRMRLALEMRIDEIPNEGIVAAGLVDLEPHAAFGGELRWMHTISDSVAASAGGAAYVVPGTLLGPCAGIEARVKLSKKAMAVLGPELTVFVVGSDLPENAIVWQGLFQAGFRADFF